MSRTPVSTEIGPATPLSVAAPAILTAKAEPFFRLEDAARSGADADAVHDMRVASRRLREAMRLFGPLYPVKESKRWYARVRRVTSALGPVRDSDVFIDILAKLGAGMKGSARAALTFVVGRRIGQREAELEQLDRELSRLDLRRARKEFEVLVTALDPSVSATMPLADFAYAAVAERAALVFRLQPEALDVSRVASQHALRILYKRLRYAVEVFAPCYGEDYDGAHDVLTGMQDALGELHDYHLFLDLVDSPAMLEAAVRAGLKEADFADLRTVLAERAAEAFARFAALESAHPAESMLPALLLPLTRRPQEPAADQPAVERETEVVAQVLDPGDTTIPYVDEAGDLVLPPDELSLGPFTGGPEGEAGA